MHLQLDHIFVCVSPNAPEAEFLIEAGLVEGSSNVHPGQGTANRRFFFDCGFLELIWVHDEVEAKSDSTAPTQLWERWAGRAAGSNPFGMCFSSANGVRSAPPFETRIYQPGYLAKDQGFLFADRLPLREPEIFIMNWPRNLRAAGNEPTSHPLGVTEMLSVSVGLHGVASVSSTLRAIRDAGLVDIHQSSRPELVISFRSDTEFQLEIPALGLSLEGQPDPSGPQQSVR